MVDGLIRIGKEGMLVEKLRRGNERRWLATPAVIVLAAAVLFLSAGNVFPQAGVRKPNVVLIMADDMGYEVISANGGTSYQTPAFDRIAQEGMRFTNAHSQPLCTPSRVKLMTGKYNWRNYVDFARMEPGQYTFAHFMREAGYATGLAASDVRVRSTDNDTFGSGSAPFRAWLARLPAQHDGGDFDVRLGFDAAPDGLSESQIRNNLIAMQGGRIVGVQPVNNRAFTLTVQPDGNADVVMTIRPTGSCGGVTDVCTRRSGSLLPLQTGYVAWIPGSLK